MKFLKVFILTLVFSTAILANPNAAESHTSFAPLVEKLLPTVVNISTIQNIKKPVRPKKFQKGSKFEEFEKYFKQFEKTPKEFKNRKAHSLGSGVIINANGYILTNNHVIANAEEIKVTLHNNTSFDAKVIGRDPKTDIALLKIESEKPLPFAKFGDSDAAKVGDWIIAIGNPFGLGGTVTAGIISATARDIHAGPYDEFLQTDAAINKGNSGGPMFNMDGRIIGINTAIFSPNGVNGGNVGIGFAVPSSMLQPIVKGLIEDGSIKRGWLGVRIQKITKDIAESVGLKKPNGALVIAVEKGSPAAKAGIIDGDVILEFNGERIHTMRKLPRMVANTDIGEKVPMLVLRNNKEIKLSVILGQLKEAKPLKKKTILENDIITVLNMDLMQLNDEARKLYNIPADVNGLLVVNIQHDGDMNMQGIYHLDVITKTNYQEIKTVDDFVNALKSAKEQGRKKALVRVLRQDGKKYFVTVSTDVDGK